MALWASGPARSTHVTWQGAFFGAVLGLLLTHSIWGLLVGALIGQIMGQGASHVRAASPRVAEVFFRHTFTLMGYVAKSDGRVSEAEIQAARLLMQELKLGAEQVAQAIEFFRVGKSPGFDAQGALHQVREACGSRRDLIRMFFELQFRAALLGNNAQGPAHSILAGMAGQLGISGLEFVHMEAMLRAQYQARTGGWSGGAGAGAGSGRRSQSRAGTYGRPANLDWAYQELEIPSTATNDEVRKAYRRQMNRHHPDKLVAKGLPESMAEMAKEKTQRIQEAYEAICAARGLK